MKLTTCISMLLLFFSTPLIAQVKVTHHDKVSERTINQLQLDNTPIETALRLVGDLGRVEVFVDTSSLDSANVVLSKSVTISVRNASIQEIMSAVLPQGVSFVEQDGKIVVASNSRIKNGQPFVLKSALKTQLKNVSQLAIEQAFSQHMPVHFDHMPLEAALQMLVGPAGKHVQFDASAHRMRFAMVTMHRDGSSIQDSLEALLSEAGLTYKMAGHQMIVSSK